MTPHTPQVLVLATEIVPLPGLPTVGGGLRGWTLAQGLRAAGFAVTLLFPREPLVAIADQLAPDRYQAALAQTFSWAEPEAILQEYHPDVVVCCSWFLAARLGPCSVPLAVDLAGPVLLEFLYQDPQKARSAAAQKVQGLAAADFVTCAGERQRAYFYPWLILAGFDPAALTSAVATIPISTAPESAAAIVPPANPEPVILFAGVALPWQDPLLPLQATLTTLEERGAGTLDLHLYLHPEHSHEIPWLDWVRTAGQSHPRLRFHEVRLRPYAELLALYRSADLAFDLFARNPERELAFNTRTVDYLAAGLPPLYSDYAELAEPISHYRAGYIVDPADPQAVQTAVATALDNPDDLRQRRQAARHLVDDLLTWNQTIAPLARWCAVPSRRQPAPNTLTLADLLPAQAEQAALLTAAQAETRHWQEVAEEREAYAQHLEAAWQEQGQVLATQAAALARWQARPWQTAWQQRFGKQPQDPAE